MWCSFADNKKSQASVSGKRPFYYLFMYLFISFLTRTAQKTGLWCTKRAVDFLAAILLLVEERKGSTVTL